MMSCFEVVEGGTSKPIPILPRSREAKKALSALRLSGIIINIRGQIENRPLENTRFAGRK